MKTLGQAFDQVQQALQNCGVDLGQGTLELVDEAAWLTLGSLGLPLDTDLSDAHHRSFVLTAAQQEQLAKQLHRRTQERVPTAYLLEQAWLQGVDFYVDSRVIIPRSLIAEPLAEGIVDAWMNDGTHHVLDLCTGNGSLAVLMAMAWPHVSVDAADLSSDALDVARINIERHGLEERIELHQGDGWRAVPATRLYDVVLCNPPYVNSVSMQALPAEFKAEPTLALAGGADGMDFIRPMLQEAKSHLSTGGILVLEIGHERTHFERAFPTLEPIWLHTSAGDDQVLLLTAQALEAL